MRFHAAYVSTSVSGDYYQVQFEKDHESDLPDSPYLLIQRQFEMPDGGKCYVETHNEEYIGHFRLRSVDFRPDGITVEIDRPNNRSIRVALAMTTAEFEAAVPILEIITGRRAPLDE